MRLALYLVAALLGAFVATLGDEPAWYAAVAAVIAFPLAAAAADRRYRPGRSQTPLLPAIMAAIAGGLLVALLIRLAFAAPGWLTSATVACGGPSSGVQRLVLFTVAVVFVAAAAPVGITLVQLGARLRTGRPQDASAVPLSFYPLAVAAAGVALIAAGYVTSC